MNQPSIQKLFYILKVLFNDYNSEFIRLIEFSVHESSK